MAGKVVHESYGAVKQQHTFTVSGFWMFKGFLPCHSNLFTFFRIRLGVASHNFNVFGISQILCCLGRMNSK